MERNYKKLPFYLFVLLILAIKFSGKSQVLTSSSLDAEVKKNISRFEAPQFLSAEEAEAFYFTNVFRMHPRYFLDSILTPYAKIKELDKSKYYKSLVKEMQKLEPLSGLNYRADLHQIAKSHASQSGKSGKTGHQNFDKRFAPYKNEFRLVGENCAYGNQSGLDFLIQLLIDENVPDLGHRKNLFNPEFNSVGNSIQFHKTYELNYVQCFGNLK